MSTITTTRTAALLVVLLSTLMFSGCSSKKDEPRAVKPFTKANYSFKKHIYEDIRNSVTYTEAESMQSFDRTLDEVFVDYDRTVGDIAALRRSSNDLKYQSSSHFSGDKREGSKSNLHRVDYGDYGNLYE